MRQKTFPPRTVWLLAMATFWGAHGKSQAAGLYQLPAVLGDRQVALTFDDGPSPVTTPIILNVLKEHAIKATFFVVGERVQRYPHLVRRMLEEGHTVGNHSFKHFNLAKKSQSYIREDLARTNRLLRQLSDNPLWTHGHPSRPSPEVISSQSRFFPRFFRAPYGRCNQTLVREALRQGMKTIAWSLDLRDWQDPPPHRLVSMVKHQLKARSIVLMHDDHPNTCQALPAIIQFIRQSGFRCVSLNDIYPEHPGPHETSRQPTLVAPGKAGKKGASSGA